jgi:deazaflavin-dependent oxidoreductase (nitroreductase family)
MAVKVPPPGTKGSPFPRFMARFGNGMQVRRFRRGAVRSQRGMPTLLLTAVGARSGQPRPVILGYLPDGDDAWLIIASLAGASRQPAWLYNLAAKPDATIEFPDGGRVDVTASTVDGPDVAAAWARIDREAPDYGAYRTKTDREISIIRLRRR